MKMELHSLVLGLGFSTGVYALKTGVGLHHYLNRENRRSRRFAVFMGFLVAYGLLFAALAAVVHHWPAGALFHYLRTLLPSGMLIHFIMAALMLVWGLALLKNQRPGKTRTLGWLALVLPCPVCCTMIFLSVAFLVSYVPEVWGRAVAILYAVFLALAFLAMGLLHRWRQGATGSPEASLGACMLAIAAYFLLSVIIMPQFSGLDEAFRLSAYSHKETHARSLAPWVTGGVLGGLFIIGFIYMRATTRRS